MKPQRILYVNGGIMNRGGIESYMMSYYRHIDRQKLQIDFIVHGFDEGAYDNEIKSMGGQIYKVPIKSKDFFGNIKRLKEIFNSNNYKLIHSHMDAMSTLVLKLAKKCDIPIRIAHSHNTQHLTNNKIKLLLNEFARKNIKRYATHYFACSKPAGRWLFGDKTINNGEVEFIKNAIEVDGYTFDKDERNNFRKKLNIKKDEMVIGHIGRFDYQKNHMYLLDIFNDLVNVNPKSKLILVGDGHLKGQILKKIKKLNLEEKVILLGIRDDVNKILNAFDIFLLPSYFEGLPLVLIEAQANGLKCIISENIAKEVNITGNISFLPIESSDLNKWTKSIINYKKNNRNINFDKFVSAGYSIKNEAEKLQEKYLNYLGELS